MGAGALPAAGGKYYWSFRRISLISAVIVAAIGVFVIAGWAFGIPVFTSLNPGSISMKFNTAVLFILSGISVIAFLKHGGDKKARLAGIILAAIVVTLGMLNLAEYVFNPDLGIDQLLFREPSGGYGTVNPGRLAPNTAVNFILLGLAAMLLESGAGISTVIAHVLASIAGLITFLAFVGYCYGVNTLSGVETYTRMAPYTTVAFFVLYESVMFSKPDRGLMASNSADNPGGLILRVSVPVIVSVMFLLGFIRLEGERRGYYNTAFGVSLFTVIRVVILIFFVRVLAVFVNKLHNESLEKEMELKGSVQRVAQMQETNRLKSQFIAVVSHELRTPLTVIKGFTSYMLKDAAVKPDEKQLDYLGIISNNCCRLERLVNEMTDISRIESGIFTIEKQPQSVKAVIDSCLDTVYHTAEKNRIKIEVSIDPENLILNMDKPRFEQALINIIGNSMKFSPPGGTLRIGVKCAYQASSRNPEGTAFSQGIPYAHLTVSDDGKGVEKANLEKVFDKFFQEEEHTTRLHQGMGLGLFIAKNIIQGHGGIVWCESEGRGKGAVFHILMPDKNIETV